MSVSPGFADAMDLRAEGGLPIGASEPVQLARRQNWVSHEPADAESTLNLPDRIIYIFLNSEPVYLITGIHDLVAYILVGNIAL